MIELVITDLDGTLLNNIGEISPKNREAIVNLKKHNVKFAIASGRSIDNILSIVTNYKLEEYVNYIIAYNGVSALNMGNNTQINEKYMSKEIILEIYNNYRNLNTVFILFDGKRSFFSSVNDTKFAEEEIRDYLKNRIEDFESIITQDFPKLMIIGEEQLLDKLSEEIRVKYVGKCNSFKSWSTYLEIVAGDISKGKMLRTICESDKINLKNVIAFGDNLNDFEMIKEAGIGIAVANAKQEIIKIADYIVPSNEEDGFYEGCKKFSL